MKSKESKRKMIKASWKIISGAKHDMAIHPDFPNMKIPIPRHTEVNEYTAEGILKAARLK